MLPAALFALSAKHPNSIRADVFRRFTHLHTIQCRPCRAVHGPAHGQDICREQVDVVARCISVAAYTGKIGDGKIFVMPVADIVRMCALAPWMFAVLPSCAWRPLACLGKKSLRVRPLGTYGVNEAVAVQSHMLAAQVGQHAHTCDNGAAASRAGLDNGALTDSHVQPDGGDRRQRRAHVWWPHRHAI